jgi:hypothetical protein
MTEREVFEDIAKMIGFNLSRDTSGEYDSEETRLIWKGWKLRSDAQHVAEARALTIRCQEIQKIIGLPISSKEQPPTDTYRQIENDGWIEWEGMGGCPVHDDVMFVDVKWRGGGGETIVPGDRSWLHYGNHYDIIAYRVIDNDGREG